MISKETQKRILADYKKARPTYKDFVYMLEDLLHELFHERGITIHAINGRTKSRKSLAGKLSKESSNYEDIRDITDLAGLRITTYFAGDVDRIANAVKEEFDIDLKNSVDKRSSLATDRFGYLSLHHVFSLTDSRTNLSEYKSFKGFKAELQIRSILQHAWAEIEHDLGYKSEIEVPQPIRRRFALLAGLLEIADREFDGIKSELAAYKSSVSLAIQETPDEVSLNLDSLTALIQSDTVRQLDVAVINTMELAISRGIELRPVNDDIANSLLVDMQQMGMLTINDIVVALNKKREVIIRFSKHWAEESIDWLPAGTSIYQLWLIYYVYKDDVDLIKRLTELNFGKPKEIAKDLTGAIKKVCEELGPDSLKF